MSEMTERHLPIRPMTAQLLRAANSQVQTAIAALGQAQARFDDMLRMVYAEHGIEAAEAVQVTEKEPFELVIRVPQKPEPTIDLATIIDQNKDNQLAGSTVGSAHLEV